MQAKVAVIGGGPAGLMSADVLSGAGLSTTVFDRMPSVGRKFLYAGRGGLNLTHTEPAEAFMRRFGAASGFLLPALRAFGPDEVRSWAEGLGIPTFVGSSGRVFPVGMKASPLLRAWLARLVSRGVAFRGRHRWTGWSGDALAFDTPDGAKTGTPDAVVLACGGGSWPHLGSDGAWTAPLAHAGVHVQPLKPANMGFDVAWSPIFIERFAGAPAKPVVMSVCGRSRRGEFIVTRNGLEGGLLYPFSAALRDTIEREGVARVTVDLAPDRSADDLAGALARPRGRRSTTDHLRRTIGLDGVKLGLLREGIGPALDLASDALARSIKALTLELKAARPLKEAISTAGGLALGELDEGYMIRRRPGVFACGEMLDWEAPTGGYLLTACFATGAAAGHGVLDWLNRGNR